MKNIRHIMQPTDLTIEEIDNLVKLADNIIAHPEKYLDVCKGKILATLFYEPSTRTRFSFEAAMLRLGGQVIGFSDPAASSVSKGESIQDTIRMVSGYADVCAMRHPKEGAPLLASKASRVPVINAGDGGHYHPTQTLTDLMTIHALKNKFSGLNIAFCGDLKFGRTVHSLIQAMNRYPNNTFYLVSHEHLQVPEYVTSQIDPSKLIVTDNLMNVLPKADVLYMTRVQKERFVSEEEYMRLKDDYILTAEKMKSAKKDMIVLHPLPRVNEIEVAVDDDPRAVYFDQARYGMFIRMALIATLLEVVK